MKMMTVNGLTFPDVSMYEFLKQSAEEHATAISIGYMGRKISYSEMMKRIDECADSFVAAGVKEGDIVTICMPNSPEGVYSIYALNKIGAIANIIHPLSAEGEITRYVNSADCKVMIAIDVCTEKLLSIVNDTSLETIIIAGPDESMPAVLKVGYKLTQKSTKLPEDSRFISWKKFIANGKNTKSEPLSFPAGVIPAVILHSGGTTGTPKEIMLSNRNFNSIGIQGRLILKDISEGDSTLGILPIFHAFGLGICIHVMFSLGATAILIPRFEAKKFADMMKKYHPTMLLGVPTLYEAMMSDPKMSKQDLSYLKYVISGGDQLSSAFEKRFNNFLRTRNAKITITQGYGLTESLGATCLATASCYKPGSIGKPYPGNKFCIVSPGTQNVLPPNTEGEICICGPTIMMGYRNNEKETNDVLQIHSDGKIWLHTGDIGMCDENGCYFYRLRLKRLIISSGYNVYPQHIEKIIENHKAVLKCTVIGIPHPYKIEVAKAYIVLKSGYEETEELKQDIINHCKKNLARYSIPAEYEYRKAIPKTLLGKTDFNQLKQEHMMNCKNGENYETNDIKEKEIEEGSGDIRVQTADPVA